jgi:hypothetical protein
VNTLSIAKRTLMLGMTAVTFVVSVAAYKAAAVEVSVKSQNTTGTRPDGSTVLIDIKVDAAGAAASLNGTGRHFGSGGLRAYWDVSGEIAGNFLTLSGTVLEASDPVFVGSPIEITADIAGQAVTFAFGPLTGGRFAGHTIVTHGAAKIDIRQ